VAVEIVESVDLRLVHRGAEQGAVRGDGQRNVALRTLDDLLDVITAVVLLMQDEALR